MAQDFDPSQGEMSNQKNVSKLDRLRSAMLDGDPDAPLRLANMYLEGKEVPRSCDQAVKVLEIAAAKPNVRARNRLAALYAIGSCVQHDRVQAYHWLLSALAVDPDDPWAQQNRDLTWRQMTQDERNAALFLAQSRESIPLTPHPSPADFPWDPRQQTTAK
jgi:TPR repeat protein